MKMRHWMIASVLLAASAAQGLPSYSVVEIPAQPGHDFLDIKGLNNNGQVLVLSVTLDNPSTFTPYLWSPSTGPSFLDQNGVWTAFAEGLNDLGQSVGYRATWDSIGVYSELPFAGQVISNNGLVFGVSETIYGMANTPVVWSESTGLIELPHVLDSQYHFWDVNDSGVAVAVRNGYDTHGGSTIVTLKESLLVSSSGVTTITGLPGSDSAIAGAINNAGMMIGQSGFGETHRPTIWMPDGSLIDLGPDVGVLDVNNLGQVLGNGPDGPFLWSAESGFQTLDLPPEIEPGDIPTHLNDLGQIVFWRGANFPQRALLVTPIPSPGACALIALAGLAASRRRRAS